jgi:hypothetical protein
MSPYTLEGASPKMYRLAGVVVHTGTADMGHYYSFIRERETRGDGGRWIEFNDRLVREFNVVNLDSEAFGGTGPQVIHRYTSFHHVATITWMCVLRS